MKDSIVNLFLLVSIGWLKAVAWLLRVFLRLLLALRSRGSERTTDRMIEEDNG